MATWTRTRKVPGTNLLATRIIAERLNMYTNNGLRERFNIRLVPFHDGTYNLELTQLTVPAEPKYRKFYKPYKRVIRNLVSHSHAMQIADIYTRPCNLRETPPIAAEIEAIHFVPAPGWTHAG